MKNLLLILCCLSAAPALQASSLLFLSPSTSTVGVGDTFEVDLFIGDLTQYFVLPGGYTTSDLYAFQVEVDFDPNILQVTNVNEGTLLPDYASSIGTSTAWFGGIVDNVDGNAVVLDSLIGANYGAYTGNGGQLFSIDFQAIALSSSSTISISNVCMQNYHDDVPNGTCDLSDQVIGTSNLNATSVVQVTTPEPATWIYLAIGAAALAVGSVRRKRGRIATP
jgi:hypothetical protein